MLLSHACLNLRIYFVLALLDEPILILEVCADVCGTHRRVPIECFPK